MTQDPYFLSSGSHTTADDGRCAMEWVAYLAGEPHSDHPICVSPVLSRFCIVLNDRLGDADRQKLRPYLARTIGTAGDGMDAERIRIARAWLIERLSKSMDLAGCEEAAARLRALPDGLALEAFHREILRARDEANGARGRALARLRAKFPAAAYADAAADAAAYAYAAAAYAAYADAADAYAYAAAYADAAADAAAYAAYADAADAAPSLSEIRAAVEARLAPMVAEAKQAPFELLERMLPKELIQLPVVSDAAAVCTIEIPAELVAVEG